MVGYLFDKLKLVFATLVLIGLGQVLIWSGIKNWF